MRPLYDTQTFNQVFPKLTDFKYCLANDFDGYAGECISDENQTKLFWLLYARYGNTHMINLSVNQFKAKLVAIIFQKGPSWERNLSLQTSIRGLTEDELRAGAVSIYNTAANPETAPGTQSTEEIGFVNAQNVSKHKRSKLDAYSYLQELLRSDVTEAFISSFSVLFSKFARPITTAIYENNVEIDEEGEDDNELDL